jgi:hypothetical protein
MKTSEIIKECRVLAKAQNLTFRRSKTVNKINNKPCYAIESGVEFKTLHQGSICTVWETLLSESLANQ